MSTRYYLADALQADFTRDLGKMTLDASSRDVLSALANSGALTGRLRAEFLSRTDGQPLPCSLAGTLVVYVEIDPAKPTLFLHSGWWGLERFSDLATLIHTVQQRLGNSQARLETVAADDPLFQARMQRTIRARLERLERFQEEWTHLPGVFPDDIETAEQALAAFWDAPASNAAARREQLAGVLADAYQSTVLEAEHEQLLTAAEAQWLKQAISGQGIHKLSLYSNPSAPVKLAAGFALHNPVGAANPWFLYLPDKGLQLFSNQAALHDWLVNQTRAGALKRYVSRDDHALLNAMSRPGLRLDAPDHELFVDRADALIGLQQRNLAYTLQRPGHSPEELHPALYLLPLIDPALQPLPWTRNAAFPALPTDPPPLLEAQGLRRRLHDLAGRHIDLKTCARARLNMGLALINPAFSDAAAAPVTLADGARRDLLAVLLERVCRQQPASILLAKQGAGPLSHLPGSLLETLLDGCQARLRPFYLALQRMSQGEQRADLMKVRCRTQALEHKLQQTAGEEMTIDAGRVQQDEEHRHQVGRVSDTWSRCQAARVPWPAFDHALGLATEDEGLAARLDHLCLQLPAVQLAPVLPSWLVSAGPAERAEYAMALDQLHRAESQVRDYRSGIPTLHDYARARLMEKLALSRPDPTVGPTPDPDQIRIEMTTHTAVAPWIFGHEGFIPQGIAASTRTEHHSLTTYAISHFSRSQTAVLRARLADGTPTPDWMTPHELHRLVDSLDIGGRYRQLLESQLGSRAPLYAKRRGWFAARSLAQLRVAAIQARLSEDINARSFSWINAVLTMPDGLAREPVDGIAISLRPMALVPAPGMAADRVEGLYLIGPSTAGAGPVVLYAAVGARFVFKTFADDQALLAAARQEGPLQTLIVQQVAEPQRSRYAHGGLRQAHLPTDSADLFDLPLPAGPPQLATQAFTGNAWHLLFADRVRLIQALATSQTVSSGEALWESFKFLMGLGIEQMSFLAEGRLGQLLALWNGIVQADAAVQAAVRHQWGASLGQLAMALLSAVPAASVGLPRTSREQVANDPILQAELRQFETSEGLESLKKDPRSSLYEGADGTRYATAGGRVYPVWQTGQLTRVGTEHRPGPHLQADADGTWQLGRLWDLRYGGFQTRRLKPPSPSSAVSQLLSVRALGMHDIRKLSMDKARRIWPGPRLCQAPPGSRAGQPRHGVFRAATTQAQPHDPDPAVRRAGAFADPDCRPAAQPWRALRRIAGQQPFALEFATLCLW